MHCLPSRNLSIQWLLWQHSFLTVAGPCRILTCFHLSFISAFSQKFWGLVFWWTKICGVKNIVYLLYFSFHIHCIRKHLPIQPLTGKFSPTSCTPPHLQWSWQHTGTVHDQQGMKPHVFQNPVCIFYQICLMNLPALAVLSSSIWAEPCFPVLALTASYPPIPYLLSNIISWLHHILFKVMSLHRVEGDNISATKSGAPSTRLLVSFLWSQTTNTSGCTIVLLLPKPSDQNSFNRQESNCNADSIPYKHWNHTDQQNLQKPPP